MSLILPEREGDDSDLLLNAKDEVATLKKL